MSQLPLFFFRLSFHSERQSLHYFAVSCSPISLTRSSLISLLLFFKCVFFWCSDISFASRIPEQELSSYAIYNLFFSLWYSHLLFPFLDSIWFFWFSSVVGSAYPCSAMTLSWHLLKNVCNFHKDMSALLTTRLPHHIISKNIHRCILITAVIKSILIKSAVSLLFNIY